MINSSIEINEKCEVMSRSCSMIKPYQKAIVSHSFSSTKARSNENIFKVETSVYKAGLQIFSKKSDLCDQKSKISDILKVGFGIFGIPMTCYYNSTPFFCYKNEKVVTFSESTMRLFQIFPVNGNQSVAKIKITHDEGTSCFETGSEMGEDRKKN